MVTPCAAEDACTRPRARRVDTAGHVGETTTAVIDFAWWRRSERIVPAPAVRESVRVVPGATSAKGIRPIRTGVARSQTPPWQGSYASAAQANVTEKRRP